MEFSYVVADRDNKKRKGLLEANNEREVLEYLRANNFTPLSIKKHQKTTANIPFLKGVKNSDIVLFTRQLSSMITTGLTLLESLNVLKDQTNKPDMQRILDDLIAQVSEGSSFSQALSSHKGVFSEVYIALIQAAETGGLLDKVLARLAENLEKMEDLKKHVRSAMFYPMIVIAGVVGVIVIMNIFVIPQLGKLYESLNLELPLTTKIVLFFSKLTTTLYPVLILLVVAFIFLFARFKKTEMGKRTLDKLILRVPVIGEIVRLSILDEITRTLSLLIGAGTSIIQALNITARVSGNVWYKDAVHASTALVEKGVPLSSAMQQQNIFPGILVQMAKVGEATGRIDESLQKVAEYFERDLDLKVKTLTTSLEPILIVVLGVVVGFLIVSVITPIYGLVSQIQ